MVRQVFKGKTLTRTTVKNRILKIWEMTDETERFDWYANANALAKALALSHQKDFSKTVGVIAALSPVKTWEQNLVVARELIMKGDCGHIEQFKNKARRILDDTTASTDEAILDILNGRKISAFYLNIKYPNRANHITIDRHALSIALGYWTTDEDYAGMTAKQYEFFVQCYILAAMQAGVSPLTMQSATWVKWRKIKREY